MKTQLGLLMADAEVNLLRAKSQELGVSQGTLLGFALRYTLDKCPPEPLAKWASLNKPVMGRKLQFGLTKRERSVYDAFSVLLKRAKPGFWRFDAAQIAAVAGCRPVEATGALYALQARGFVHDLDTSKGKVDEWGRPIGVIWARVDMMPEDARERWGLKVVTLDGGQP